MEIVISTDNNYIMPTGVLMTSICENNKDEKIRFHILIDESVTVKSKESLNRIAEGYGKQIVYYLMAKSLFDGFPVGRDGLPVSAYYRLAIAKILSENIDKVLYLDSDIIVRHSLKELWETDIQNYAIGCVTDVCNDDIKVYNRLKYSNLEGYFNSGVLLINLRYWREHCIDKQLVTYLRNNIDKIVNSDQDILNYVLRKEKFKLPLKYNVQHGFFLKEAPLSWEYDVEVNSAIKDPYILHFTDRANNKPWVKGCRHPYKQEFFKYKALTQWASVPVKTYNIFFKTKLYKFFQLFGIEICKYSKSEYKTLDSLQ